MLIRSFCVSVKGQVTETSTVVSRGLKPLADTRPLELKKTVARTGFKTCVGPSAQYQCRALPSLQKWWGNSIPTSSSSGC